MLFMERFPDLMMEEAWMPEDSLTNEAPNQAQLSQGQVSTLALQPLSQLLPPISAEHLDQDVKSKAKPSFHPVLQPSSQLLLPVSAECLGEVKSKVNSSSQSLSS